MTGPACPHAASGCNYPEGDCADLCRRLDTLVVRQLASGPVYFTASGGAPRWVSRPELAEAFPARAAANLANVFARLEGPHFSTTSAPR